MGLALVGSSAPRATAPRRRPGDATHSPADTRRAGEPCRSQTPPGGSRSRAGWLVRREVQLRGGPSRRLRCLCNSTGTMPPAVVPGHDFDTERYIEKLQSKSDSIARQFSFAGVLGGQVCPLGATGGTPAPTTVLPGAVELEVHPSPVSHYRLRCRFGISRGTGGLTYIMGSQQTPLTQFPVACWRINHLMPVLLDVLDNCVEELSVGVREAHFLTTLAEPQDCVITLIYDRSDGTLLKDRIAWQKAAAAARRCLGPNVSLVGRTKGVQEVSGVPYVTETLRLRDGRSLLYHQIVGAFSNPNGAINQSTLNWLCDVVHCSGAARGALLELYCGCGNHTVALAGCFEECLAVELNPKLAAAAEENLQLNGVTNAKVVCGDSMNFSRKVLEDPLSVLPATEVEAVVSSTVLVDPPRVGLDPLTLSVCSRFRHILYISCNQDTLEPAVRELLKTHTLERMALFDHFPYTNHTECGVYLRAREGGGTNDTKQS